MRTRSTFLAILLGCLSLTACMVGEGDGTDTSDSDYTYCQPRQIDNNADGVADGLDINCDGVIDFAYGGGGGGSSGGGAHNSCSTMVSVNGVTKAISCSGDGSSATCECRVNGTLQNTCTQQTASCSIGVPNANCCGF